MAAIFDPVSKSKAKPRTEKTYDLSVNLRG